MGVSVYGVNVSGSKYLGDEYLGGVFLGANVWERLSRGSLSGSPLVKMRKSFYFLRVLRKNLGGLEVAQ